MTSAIDTTRAAAELRDVIGQLVRRLRGEYKFPLAQIAVMGWLYRGGASTTSALAAAQRVKPQSMGRTVGDLEAAGLVRRRPDPADGRQRLVELTGAGRAAVEESRRRREGWLGQAIATGLTAAEQQVLVDAVELLRRLAAMEPNGEPDD